MKKGFTLIELLAVIAILAIIIVFAVPNITKLFSESKNKLSKIQQNQIKDAVKIYLDDTCINPISDEYLCDFSVNNKSNTTKVTGTIPLETFATKGYISSSDITENCNGNIVITDNLIDLSDVTCSY